MLGQASLAVSETTFVFPPSILIRPRGLLPPPRVPPFPGSLSLLGEGGKGITSSLMETQSNQRAETLAPGLTLREKPQHCATSLHRVYRRGVDTGGRSVGVPPGRVSGALSYVE